MSLITIIFYTLIFNGTLSQRLKSKNWSTLVVPSGTYHWVVGVKPTLLYNLQITIQFTIAYYYQVQKPFTFCLVFHVGKTYFGFQNFWGFGSKNNFEIFRVTRFSKPFLLPGSNT